MPGMGVPLTALEQIMRQRAKADPTAPPITAPPESEADQLYRLLMEQSPAMREPTTHERIAAGLMIPNTPIVHGRSAPGRMFLRGLVGGYKGSQGFGVPGQGSLSRAALTGQLRGGGGSGINPIALLNLQYRARADARQERAANRSDEQFAELMRRTGVSEGMDAKRFEAMEAERRADNARADAGLAISRDNNAISRGHLALAQQKEARMAQAAQAARAGVNPKWPDLWKREYERMAQGLMQKLNTDESFTFDMYMDAIGQLSQKFADREVAVSGKVPPTYFEEARQRGAITSGGSQSGANAPQGENFWNWLTKPR